LSDDRDNLSLFLKPAVAVRGWPGRLLLSAFCYFPRILVRVLLSARCSYNNMICATSCADVIAIAIRCADDRFNHEPGWKNKARGPNYNSGFGSRFPSVIPTRAENASPARTEGPRKEALIAQTSLCDP
jgi:hypothetical protein